MNYQKLQTLVNLRDAGEISEEEFKSAKEKLEYQDEFSSSNKFGMSDGNYLLLMHLSQFSGYIIPFLGVVAPIVLWQMNKDDEEIDLHGKNIANFMLSMLIYFIISFILIFVGIGILFLVILGILGVVFPIIGAIKANNGEYWEYPLSIKFFKTDEYIY